MRKVVSLHLPNWPIQRVQRRSAAPHEASCTLIVEAQRGQSTLVACCQRARAAGVQPGMHLAHARALLPSDAAMVLPHDPARDEAALLALARWLHRFTPVTAADPPDGLLLDLTGCERLYGSDPAMLKRVAGALRRLGLTVRAALAPTVGCAWAVARFGAQAVSRVQPHQIDEALHPLPVRALRLDEHVEQALHEVAVDRIEQLMQLPREALADRFGHALLRRLDQARGDVFEGIETTPLNTPVQAERTFTGPVTQPHAIEITVHELLMELTRKLHEHGRGARRIMLSLERLDGALHRQSASERLTLSHPSRDAAHLWALLRPRVEKLDLGRGVEQLALTALRSEPLPHAQTTWLEAGDDTPARDRHRAVGELVDVLTSRLGSERVRCVELLATHVPEQAFAYRSSVHEPTEHRSARDAAPGRTVPADRPSLLHTQPEPVDVTLLAPDGPLVQMWYRGEVLALRTSIGPERITPRWWLVGNERRKPPPRDYFKVQDEHGRWWWLYRKAGTAQWFVHGQWT